MKNQSLPTKKQESQVTSYNPKAAELARTNLLKHVASYPKVLTQENLKTFYVDGNDYLKIYDAETKPIQITNQKRLDDRKLLKDALDKAKLENNKIVQLKKNANDQISFYAKNTEEGKELEKWNEYFSKYGKYTTFSYSDFEKLCNQFQIQKAKEKEIEKLSEFERLLNEPTKVQSVEITDVENVTYNTKVVVDFDKLDCTTAMQVLVDAGKGKQITEMLRIALKDSKQEINGITYVESVSQNIRR